MGVCEPCAIAGLVCVLWFMRLLLPVVGFEPDFVMIVLSGVGGRPFHIGRGMKETIAGLWLIFYRRIGEQIFKVRCTRCLGTRIWSASAKLCLPCAMCHVPPAMRVAAVSNELDGAPACVRRHLAARAERRRQYRYGAVLVSLRTGCCASARRCTR